MKILLAQTTLPPFASAPAHWFSSQELVHRTVAGKILKILIPFQEGGGGGGAEVRRGCRLAYVWEQGKWGFVRIGWKRTAVFIVYCGPVNAFCLMSTDADWVPCRPRACMTAAPCPLTSSIFNTKNKPPKLCSGLWIILRDSSRSLSRDMMVGCLLHNLYVRRASLFVYSFTNLNVPHSLSVYNRTTERHLFMLSEWLAIQNCFIRTVGSTCRDWRYNER